MLSTCRVLVKNLKGSEFNVPVSETARIGNILMSSFFKREILWVYSWVSHKPEIIMKHSVYIQVRFGSKQLDLVWVRGKLIGPEQRTTNSDSTSQTQLVKIIFCQPKLKLELIIHKVLHALLLTWRSNHKVVDVLFYLFPVNLPLARSGHT